MTKTRRNKNENTEWEKSVRHLVVLQDDGTYACRCDWTGDVTGISKHIAKVASA